MPNLGQLLVVYLFNYYSSVSIKKEDRSGRHQWPYSRFAGEVPDSTRGQVCLTYAVRGRRTMRNRHQG
jgi:hypothetical protein